MNNKGRPPILIVENEIYVQELLCATFQGEGYECEVAADFDAALSKLASRNFDLAFVDIRVPGNSGMRLLGEIKARRPETVVVVVTALDEASVAVDAMRAGAFDYIIKPFSLERILASAVQAMEKRELDASNREYQRYLEQRTEEHESLTRRLFDSMAAVLATLLEQKPLFKGGYLTYIAEMSRQVAREFKMTDDGARKVYVAALLHDLGMIGLEDMLLVKPGALTQEEQLKIREHITLTETLLKPILGDDEIMKYIRHHHEWYDGTGYPDGLRGRIIPLGARIIAVTDAFAAMTRGRPYQEALSPEEAVSQLQEFANSHFDQQVVSVFADLYERVFRNLHPKPASPQ
jgi:response regulator RpfG family c-di-GMP phosphodiesterase